MKPKPDPIVFSFPFTFDGVLEEPIYVTKRPNGVYAALIGPDKRASSLGTRSKKVADKRGEELRRTARVLAAKECLLQVQALADDKATQTPLADLLEEYILYCKAAKKKTTVSADVFYLRDTFGEICDSLKKVSRKKDDKEEAKDSPAARRKRQQMRDPEERIKVTHVEDLTKTIITSFIDSRIRTRKLSPKSANRYRDSLLAFTNWAVESKEVVFPDGVNPVALVKKKKEANPEIRFLTLEQVKEQLDALADKPELQTMVALYIYAGLRREEALWLTAADVDFNIGKNGAILVRRKSFNGESWQTKTGIDRIVPISKKLRPYLEAYKRRPSVGNWYFPSPKATRWDPDNFSEHLRNANRAKGLEWSCWEYRHTFGSQLAMRGESLYKIATLMGNSPEVCRKHYAALTPQSLEGATEFPDDHVDFDGSTPDPTPAKDTAIRRGHLRLLDSPVAQEG